MTRMVRRRALLIGIEHYQDPSFTDLPSTQADIWGLGQVLKHPNIGAFVDVEKMSDLPADDMKVAIHDFLQDVQRDELALLYISGHGVRLPGDGQFYFVASDTMSERIAQTAVSAGFVNEALEASYANQRVVMIDCCRSGGFAHGFRTEAKSVTPDNPLDSSGVYVLSSSRAGEDSYAAIGTDGHVRPSVFTGEVIDALHTGSASRGASGDISVDGLFDHVNKRMRAKHRQIPVKSAIGVDDRIVLASSPIGTPPQLKPYVVSSSMSVAGPTGNQTNGGPKSSGRPSWSQLFDYFRDCVLEGESHSSLLNLSDAGESYACMSGSERILSGVLDDDGCVPMSEETEELVSALTDKDELWAGYPTVVVTGSHSRTLRDTQVAPLLMRRVEVVSSDGRVKLQPFGPVRPNPALARHFLDKEQASHVIRTYRPTWMSGQYERMVTDVRALLNDEFELLCDQLDPEHLEDKVSNDIGESRGCNVAMLMVVSNSHSTTAQLLSDLESLKETKRTDKIPETALASLGSMSRRQDQTPTDPVRPVTPLTSNESQYDVTSKAFRDRLTVVSGPPGTGKSQLIVNVVATALNEGQKVLIASNNNKAVDEVWRRCNDLVPNSVIRTGGRGKRDETTKALNALTVVDPPGLNVATARATLRATESRGDRNRKQFQRVADTERRLLALGSQRDDCADRLGSTVDGLVTVLSGLPRWQRWVARMTRLSRARWFGEARRARSLRRWGIEPVDSGSRQQCADLAAFLAAQDDWNRLRPVVANIDDDANTAEWVATQDAVCEDATTLMSALVAERAKNGYRALRDMLTDATWPRKVKVLEAAPCWAVTNLSARYFPLDAGLFDLVVIDEASQCGIAAVLPLLYRAKRALIIGDPMQLPHICEINPRTEQEIRKRHGIDVSWLDKHQLSHRRHSAFQAAEAAVAGGYPLLDEHYRCHPDIAGVANRLFYANELTLLTDVRDRCVVPNRAPIVWANVVGTASRPPGGRSWINTAEADKTVNTVRWLRDNMAKSTTIGVVTPYRAQADLLTGRLSAKYPDVEVGTIHTFQGGERDIMVFSLVGTSLMKASAVNWFNRSANLWNVAITRARSHLIVVGDRRFWSEKSSVVPELLDPRGAMTVNEVGGAQQRLFDMLRSRDLDVDLNTVHNGNLIDVVATASDGERYGYLLDNGCPDGDDSVRHLRIGLRRRELASAALGAPVSRIPAWRLYDREAQDRPAPKKPVAADGSAVAG